VNRGQVLTEQAIVPVIIEIPYPPSVNGIWRGSKGGRHYLSAKYKSWREAAGLMVNAQARGKRVSGPFAVEIQASRPDKRRRDIDNIVKPILDLLASMGVTPDDSECQMIHAEWVGRGEGVRVAVRPTKRWGEADGLLSSSAMGG
jgi:crossover junction endodeoxyribonuclease RusA